MNMDTIFARLKRHYGTHGRAAQAVGYSRQRYLQFRQGSPMPRWALHAILAVTERINEADREHGTPPEGEGEGSGDE